MLYLVVRKVRLDQKKAARTVICSCREASDATCISRGWLKNFYGRRFTLPLILNIPQCGDEKMKICPIIEI
jgi:hypothetical protein